MLEWVPPKYLNTYKVLNLITAKMLCHTLVGIQWWACYLKGGTAICQVGRNGNMAGWGSLHPECYSSKQETWNQFWFNIGPTSLMVGQHWTNIGSMSRVFWEFSAVQSQKAVSDYFTSKQILPFGFAKQYCRVLMQRGDKRDAVNERSRNMRCIQPTENRWPINIPKKVSVTHRGRICLIICEQYVTLFWRIVRCMHYIQVFCEGWKRKHHFTHYLSDNMWTWSVTLFWNIMRPVLCILKRGFCDWRMLIFIVGVFS